MCGISGIIGRDGVTPEDLARVGAMSRALVHRGPDDSGVYSAPHVALASRRLSIIDIEGGRQPLYNEDRSLALIANGEIYNHAELRRRLEGRGHRFTTGSDCETILHAYAEYGTACVEHLRGMFAFALWDDARRRLVLARDPMGEKPLYLYERGGRLLFASEMKALLRSGEVPFEIDPEAVDLYFHYQYVPEPRTAVRGVRKLDAAHLLVPAPVRESVSELLGRHRAAREAERAASVSFREGLENQASVRGGEAPRTWWGAAMPLVTEAEAREIWGRRMVMNDHQKRSWDQMTMCAEVAAKSGGSRRNSTPSLHEWRMRYSGAASRGSEYERAIGDAKVLSYSDARALVRQQEKELGRNRQAPSRSR